MGALIGHASLIHAHFEKRGERGFVVSTNPLYSTQHADVLGSFFVREPLIANLVPFAPLATESFLSFVRPGHIPLAEAQLLFARYFQLNGRLLAEIASATD